MSKILISRHQAVKMLDTSYSIFKALIEPELELVKIGNREKVLLQSVYDYITEKKYQRADPAAFKIKPQKNNESFCVFKEGRVKITL
jgi:hypothetical protein